MKKRININNIKHFFSFESVGIIHPNEYTKTPIILGTREDGKLMVLFYPYETTSIEITPNKGIIIRKNYKAVNFLNNVMPSVFEYFKDENSFALKIGGRKIYSVVNELSADNMYINIEDVYDIQSGSTFQLSKI